jgi:hypothetical protein
MPIDSERLLSGGVPEDEGLRRLGSHIDALRRTGRCVPTEAYVQQFVASATRLVESGERRAAPASTRRDASSLRRPGLTFRLAAAAAALILVLSASAGVAYAADRAVPGDTLYGFDLALEDIGLGDGGLQERLIEAGELVERGRTQDGLTLAGEAIAAQSSQIQVLRAAADALRLAADAAHNDPSGQPSEAQSLAAEKLRWLATMEPTEDEFARVIYELVGSMNPEGQGGTEAKPSDAIDQTAPGTGSHSGNGQNGTDSTGGAGGNGPGN